MVRLFSGLLIVSGIIFIALGIVVRKFGPDRWIRDFWISWAEFPEWSSWVYTGALFVFFGVIFDWLGL